MGVPPSIAARAKAWTFDGDLVTGITVDAVTLVEHGDEMFEAAPLRALQIDDPDGTNRRNTRAGDPYVEWDPAEVAGELARKPWLARVESIAVGLYRDFGDPEILATVLAAAPALVELRVTHPSIVEGIADLPLPALAALLVYCEGDSGGDAAIAAFARRPRELRELQLVGCGVTADTARTIAAARWPLQYLAFGGTHYTLDDLGTDGAMALAGASSLARLATLDLVATSFDDTAVAALATSPYLRPRQLCLAENTGITDAGLATLAASSLVDDLIELAVHETSVSEAGLAGFAAAHPHVELARHYLTAWFG